MSDIAASPANGQDLDEFRERCSVFLDEYAIGEGLSNDDPRGAIAVGVARAFQATVVEAGLAGITLDPKYGGQGLTSEHEKVWREEVGKRTIMTRQQSISHAMCLPMLNEYSTQHQKDLYLKKVLSAEEVWCQMLLRCNRRQCSTVTSGYSTGRRCEPPSPTCVNVALSSPAPTPMPPSTLASRCSPST
jgi:alkylation response protein AidB-like acyl-CoA dehydrogenase